MGCKTETEVKTLEWDILNSDLLINLEINNKRRSSNDLDINAILKFSVLVMSFWEYFLSSPCNTVQ